MRDFSKNNDVKMKDVAQPLRLSLSGLLISHSLFEVIEIIGKEALERRINNFSTFVKSF